MRFAAIPPIIGGTSDVRKARGMGVIGGIGGIGPYAPACARVCAFFTRASELFPVYAQEDASDASDEGRPMRVSDIGGTSDVFSIPPMSAMTKPLRAEMPETAAWIDALRRAFGAPTIDAAIRAGMDGQPTFYARENGREIGTRSNDGPGITLDRMCIRTAAERQDERKRYGAGRPTW